MKEHDVIVYASYSQDAEIGGAIRIATNEPIPVTIIADGKEVSTTKDLGGYFVVHKTDLKAFIAAVKASEK